jgi:hypothetical protein
MQRGHVQDLILLTISQDVTIFFRVVHQMKDVEVIYGICWYNMDTGLL